MKDRWPQRPTKRPTVAQVSALLSQFMAAYAQLTPRERLDVADCGATANVRHKMPLRGVRP